ncbi:DeoR/GlpR family DNA-binding transcription regulator [Numidum massiliense]|uniref:DeoR/GlpR family DNA-binding transcription regulator n=1 Tax=Numidum massiliense TaxID=1522315 RepID=UPI0006D57AC9|nr:DeoR/GlpR family DNA-binding transcription regulator [Numidum massiliense]
MVKLFVAERRNKIMEILNKNQRLTVKELAKEIDVSEATLRSDLNQMEKEGLLTRTHGGAVLTDYIENETSFSTRKKKNKQEKMHIASQAVQLITDGQCVLFDASSTVLELARLLKRGKKRLTVVTSGIYTALELRDHPDITVILLGGVVRTGSSSLEGTLGVDVLNKINVDAMFTSANGFTFDTGLTDFNIYEVELKREMLKKASKVVALVDHTKIGKSSIASFADVSQVDTFITDAHFSDEEIAQFNHFGVEVTTTS